MLEWVRSATNKVEILPRDPERAKQALYEAQVTTRSPMGAIVYESGGILVDDGWIRILGSGSPRLGRSLMAWNVGKSMDQTGETPSFLLVADDAIGGFFAINGGAFGEESKGLLFYLPPDTLTWEALDVTYSKFLDFCFSGDLAQFYKGMRWTNWQADLKNLKGDESISFFPFLWTKESKDINSVSRTSVPVEELWALHSQQKK